MNPWPSERNYFRSLFMETRCSTWFSEMKVNQVAKSAVTNTAVRSKYCRNLLQHDIHEKRLVPMFTHVLQGRFDSHLTVPLFCVLYAVDLETFLLQSEVIPLYDQGFATRVNLASCGCLLWGGTENNLWVPDTRATQLTACGLQADFVQSATISSHSLKYVILSI
jgi:hypothetical protein